MTTRRDVEPEARPAPPSRTWTAVVHWLQGLLMGSADVIPGVSGGTVALIVGIYEDLIGSIHEIAASIGSLVRGDRRAARGHWRQADLLLVVPLIVGILIALAIGSVVLPPLIEHHPVVMSSLFFGLIAGALPVPWRRMSRRTGRHYVLAVVGAAAAFVLAGLAPAAITDPGLPLVFVSAAIAICAMILPGVSGAYLLLVLGMYDVTLRAVSSLDVVYVAVFAAGAATGLGLFSKLLAWLLEQRHDATMAVLVGLMAGSLRRLWPWHTGSGALLAPPHLSGVLLALACVAVGLAAVTALIVIGERSEVRRAPGA